MVPKVLVINYRASCVQKLTGTLDIHTLGVHVHLKYQVSQISSELELLACTSAISNVLRFLNLSSSSLPILSCITASRLSSIKSVNCARAPAHARRFVSAASLVSSKLFTCSRAHETLQRVKMLEVRTR